MSESDGQTPASQWTEAWIQQQREALRKSMADANQRVEGDAKAQAEAGSASVFAELLKTWRGALSGVAGIDPLPASQFSGLLAGMAAVGPWREHAASWREVLEAQAESQQLQQEVQSVLFRVQSDALDLVQQRVRERSSGDAAITELRDIHKLWVECGEEVYAKVAHSDAYSKLQAAFTNSAMRLRARQQKVIEQWLKQFDLPTRAELNTVHRQLREQKDKLREQKELLAGFVERMKGSKPAPRTQKTSVSTKAKSKTRKRTAR